mmetsp:Transcript_6797/g.18805  ORF Transcript_6797/g.18805 Transcript_6797/m.18805 type:complete len:221 (-) Transcript_6797:258-920(-)
MNSPKEATEAIFPVMESPADTGICGLAFLSFLTRAWRGFSPPPEAASPVFAVRENFFFSISTLNTRTLMSCPIDTASATFFTKSFEIWEMCRSPSTSQPTLTNAPKSVTETTAPLYSCPTVSSSTFIVWAGPGLGLRGPLPPARLGLASATGSSSTSDSAAARVTTCWRSTCLGCLRNRRAGRGERKFDAVSHSHVEPTSQPAPHDTSAWNRMHGAANTL